MKPEISRSKAEENPHDDLWKEIPGGQLCSWSREQQSKLEQKNYQTAAKGRLETSGYIKKYKNIYILF